MSGKYHHHGNRCSIGLLSYLDSHYHGDKFGHMEVTQGSITSHVCVCVAVLGRIEDYFVVCS